jgi:hypothetical protein
MDVYQRRAKPSEEFGRRAPCSWRPAWSGEGSRWRRRRLLDLGVLYGASRAEANNVNGKKVFILRGGNSAGQAAIFFPVMPPRSKFWCAEKESN